MAALTGLQEAAILRTLRDIECGHITLRCSIRRYDPHAGQRLAEPVLERTDADRAPAGGFPRLSEDWWDLLAERGWIRQPTEREPSCWQVTEEGRQVLARWSESEE